jgi:lysyl-tRNA synthetase class II
MPLNDQQRARLEKLRELRQQGIDPYPARSHRQLTAAQAHAVFTEREPHLASPIPNQSRWLAASSPFATWDGPSSVISGTGQERSNSSCAASSSVMTNWHGSSATST